METAYAEALWQMVESGIRPAEALRKLHASLEACGRASLLPRIRSAFVRLAAQKAARETITLSVAREKDAKEAMREAGELLASMGEKSAEAEIVVDSSLIGGWRLEGKETLVDASFKKQLLGLYNRVIAN